MPAPAPLYASYAVVFRGVAPALLLQVRRRGDAAAAQLAVFGFARVWPVAAAEAGTSPVRVGDVLAGVNEVDLLGLDAAAARAPAKAPAAAAVTAAAIVAAASLPPTVAAAAAGRHHQHLDIAADSNSETVRPHGREGMDDVVGAVLYVARHRPARGGRHPRLRPRRERGEREEQKNGRLEGWKDGRTASSEDG